MKPPNKTNESQDESNIVLRGSSSGYHNTELNTLRHVIWQQRQESNSGAPEGKAVPARHVTPVVLLLLQAQ